MHSILLREVHWFKLFASYNLLRNHIRHVTSGNPDEWVHTVQGKRNSYHNFNIMPPMSLVQTHSQIRTLASMVKDNEPKNTKITKGSKLPTSLPPLRIRRVGITDTENINRFVRSQVRLFLPGLDLQASGWRLALEDFVQRCLAQGCSLMVTRPGTSAPHGLALTSRICPWDAPLLRRWATCLRAPTARSLVRLAAHCLAAPDLHMKYGVVRMFQVWLLVQPDLSVDVSAALALRAIAFAKDMGCKMIRMDCCTSHAIEAMDKLKLNKEWEMAYQDYVSANGLKMFEKNLPYSHYTVYVKQL